jgi:cold shock CspA family protein
VQPPRFGTRPLLGKVVHFDEERGLGTIRADDGTELPFHSKSVVGAGAPVGARVTFVAAAGHGGRVEAAGITMVTLTAAWEDQTG